MKKPRKTFWFIHHWFVLVYSHLKRVQLQQLKGMWSFKLSMWKGCHLPIEDIQFSANIWYMKGLTRSWILGKASPGHTHDKYQKGETYVQIRNERHRSIMHKINVFLKWNSHHHHHCHHHHRHHATDHCPDYM